MQISQNSRKVCCNGITNYTNIGQQAKLACVFLSEANENRRIQEIQTIHAFDSFNVEYFLYLSPLLYVNSCILLSCID